MVTNPLAMSKAPGDLYFRGPGSTTVTEWVPGGGEASPTRRIQLPDPRKLIPQTFVGGEGLGPRSVHAGESQTCDSGRGERRYAIFTASVGVATVVARLLAFSGILFSLLSPAGDPDDLRQQRLVLLA